MERKEFLIQLGIVTVGASLCGAKIFIPTKAYADSAFGKNDWFKIPGNSEYFQELVKTGKPSEAITEYLKAKQVVDYGNGYFGNGKSKGGVTHRGILNKSKEKGLIANSPVVELTKDARNDTVMQTFKSPYFSDDSTVVGHSGTTFHVDEGFTKYLVEDQLYCYGLPTENTRYYNCRYCEKEYKRQWFFYKGFNDGIVYAPEKKTEIFIGARSCPSHKSRTGNHDSWKLNYLKPCGDPQPCHDDTPWD